MQTFVLALALASLSAAPAAFAQEPRAEVKPARAPLVPRGAAGNIALAIEGIEGEIAVESFSWGVTSPAAAAGAGGGTGRVRFEGLSVLKQVDAASPKLFEAAATSVHYPRAVLTVRRPAASRASSCATR